MDETIIALANKAGWQVENLDDGFGERLRIFSQLLSENTRAAAPVAQLSEEEFVALAGQIDDDSGEQMFLDTDGWLRDLYRAIAARVQQPQWQPIETAPLDEIILLSNGEDVAQGNWCDPDKTGLHEWLDCCGGMQPEPTHWMPFPQPSPKSQGGK